MAKNEEKQQTKTKSKKKQKHQHTDNPSSDLTFKPCTEVKGLRFGGQFIVKSFPVRRARPPELLRLLNLPPPSSAAAGKSNFPSITAYIPTNFTILAHQAWHTLTLGLGTRKTKVVVFVFESQSMRSAVEIHWPAEIALGDVNRKLIRGLIGCEIARFKFRKGAITFYIYAVRRIGDLGFSRADDLRIVLQSTVELKDFLDHTEMLAMPHQRVINYSAAAAAAAATAVAH